MATVPVSLNVRPLRKLRVKLVMHIGDWPAEKNEEIILPESDGVMNMIKVGVVDDLGIVTFRHPVEEVCCG